MNGYGDHLGQPPYEIVQLAHWFQRRCLKMLMDGQTTVIGIL